MALQIHHNLSRDRRGLLCTQLDRRSGVVSSRLGVSADALLVDGTTDIFEMVSSRMPIDYVVADEAQFYEPRHIDQMVRCVDELDVDIYAFGLLTSFQGCLFPGTTRLLEMADERQELQVEARCWCGRRATHNARIVDGVQVYSGDLKVVGDADPQHTATQLDLAGEAQVSYQLLCRRHWMKGAIGPEMDTL